MTASSSPSPVRPRLALRLQLALAIAGICVLTVIWLNELAFNRTVEVTSSIRAALQVRTTTTTLVHNLVETHSKVHKWLLMAVVEL